MASNKKNGSVKNWVGATILLIVAVGLAIVIAAGSAGFQNWNAAEWFNCWGTKKQPILQPDNSDVEGVGNNMIIAPGEEYGISLTSALIAVEDYDDYGISAQAETAYEFTATAFDENGSSNGVPQDMEGSVNWKNASSAWASGKNVEQFVTVTKTGDNQFRVSCLQAFGEPVILTIKSAHSTASATKQFDYVKRVSNVHIVPKVDSIYFGGDTDINPEIVYGIGTVEGEVYGLSIEYDFSSEYCAAIVNSSYYKYFVQQCSNAGIDMDWSGTFYKTFSSPLKLIYYEDDAQWSIMHSPDERQMFEENMNSAEVTKMYQATEQALYFRYALKDALNQMTNKKQIEFVFNWTYKYEGAEYASGGTISSRYAFEFGLNLPKITDVTISGQDSYVF